MRRFAFIFLTGLLFCLLSSTVALARSHNAAEYPLRVHLFYIRRLESKCFASFMVA